MAELTNTLVLTFIVGVGAVALSRSFFREQFRFSGFSVLLASVTFFIASGIGLTTSPAALSASQNSAQRAAEQELQATTSGSQYIGLEYVQASTSEEAKGDQEIIAAIKDMNDNLVVQSSNGSVFLSGTVDDRETARSLVDSTKQIPGVIQVSYELGLQNG